MAKAWQEGWEARRRQSPGTSIDYANHNPYTEKSFSERYPREIADLESDYRCNEDTILQKIQFSRPPLIPTFVVSKQPEDIELKLTTGFASTWTFLPDRLACRLGLWLINHTEEES
ncbi:hypothetical protein CRD59_00900 [Bifidobacterium xylocopae]|uniref:Uncharacterized protein n=2 Tax=Bifidobacterium xylocopae TaxID=2493119 RepID=A0A366KH83_9BIFI|nr:hypothetical protein CRD59_00900 [Bifidobacterium xylocopae]